MTRRAPVQSALARRPRSRSRWSRSAAVVLVSFGASSISVAPASAAEPSTAEALFREARDLLEKGEYAAACPKLEESQRLDPAPGTEFNLARCYELVGRLASAWGAYTDVVAATRSLGQREREQLARQRVAAIEPRLSYVVVKVASSTAPVAGLALTRDGVEMPLAQLDVAIPVDGGEHVLAASAPGRRAWSTRLQIHGEGERVTVEIPLLEEDAPLPAAPVIPNEAVTAPPVSPPTAPAERRGALQRTLSLGLFGTSLVAAGFGTYFGIQHIELGNESQDGRPDGHSVWEDSRRVGNYSTAAFITFGVLALAAGALWFTAPRAAQGSSVPRLAFTPDGRGGPLTASF